MTEPSWQSAHDANVPSTQDQHVIDTLTAVAKSATASATILPRAFRVLRDAQSGAPGAAAYDGNPGKGGSRTHCWEHHQDHAACEAYRRDFEADKHPRACDSCPYCTDCRPETMPVNDPTGEAGLTPDKAAAQAKEIRRRAERLRRAADDLTTAIEDAAPKQRPPTDKDRRTTAVDNTPGCQSCSRIDGHSLGVPYWSPIARPTTAANGNLGTNADGPIKMDLCSWCYRWTLDTGKLPSLAELRAHRDGVKVKRPA